LTRLERRPGARALSLGLRRFTDHWSFGEGLARPSAKRELRSAGASYARRYLQAIAIASSGPDRASSAQLRCMERRRYAVPRAKRPDFSAWPWRHKNHLTP
jgi:hypothetical protein